MSQLNLLVFLNAYSDQHSSNNPSLNHFKWNRSLNSVQVGNPQEQPLQLAPGETKTLFNGSRTLAQDNTTEYSIALKPLTSSTYTLSWSGGTAPNFRTPRSTGADATTQVTVTLNGPVATFTSTGGTLFNLAGVQVGDSVFVGNLFNPLNQGFNKVIAVTSTSFSVANPSAFAEGPITLGAGFASQIQIFSAAGVQVNDKLVISGGFSSATQGTYVITAVYANAVEFYSTSILPQEGPILTEAIAIYSNAKQFVYIEADQHCDISINGTNSDDIQPFFSGGLVVAPGLFMRTSTVYSLSVTNVSNSTANVLMLSVE